jgi:hypothetical protein
MGEHEYGRRRAADAPLRGLAAPGPSKVGTGKAMRARDVSRPDVLERESSQTQPDQTQPDQTQPDQTQSVGAAGSSGSTPVDS